MIEIKLNDMIDSLEAIRELSELKIKAKTSFFVSKIIKDIESNLAEFEKSRSTIIAKYGKVLKSGKVSYSKAAEVKAQKEYTELAEHKIKLNHEKIKIAEIGSAEISPKTLSKLGWLIE